MPTASRMLRMVAAPMPGASPDRVDRGLEDRKLLLRSSETGSGPTFDSGGLAPSDPRQDPPYQPRQFSRPRSADTATRDRADRR